MPFTVYRLPYIVIYFLAMYLLFLVINILNVATVKIVPLKQAALSANYFWGLLISFWFIYGILDRNYSFFIFSAFCSLVAFLFSFPLFYVVQIESPTLKGGKEVFPLPPKLLFYESVLVALFSAQVSFGASFWSKPHFLTAVFLSGLTFLLVGLFQHHIKKVLTNKIILEHSFIAALLILAFLLTK